MFCRQCGKMIPGNSIYCPECGSPTKNAQNTNRQQPVQQQPDQHYASAYNPHPTRMKQKPARKTTHILRDVIIGIVFVVVVVSVINSIKNTPADSTKNTQSQKIVQADPLPEKNDIEEQKASVPAIDDTFNTSDYMLISPDVLFEYAEYIPGTKITTVITVHNAYSDSIKANVDAGSDLMYDLSFEFDRKDIDKLFSEDDVLTIAGVVEGVETFFGAKNVTIKDCIVVGRGEIREDIESSIQAQQSFCDAAKTEAEEAAYAAAKVKRDEYVAECQSVAYNDIARNPDNYKGMKVIAQGEVIQVSEGFMNSVTFRVETDSGDVWYIMYNRPEGQSRILEGDRLICYGECDGVTSYITVLGSTVTIPSLKMEYYDIAQRK